MTSFLLQRSLRAGSSSGSKQARRLISSSVPHLQQQQQQSSSSSSSESTSNKAPPPPPEEDTTVSGRSPFQAFVDVLKEEVRKNREWQESVKQLAGERDKVADSETMKKAKEVYERARVRRTFSHCPR